MSNKGFCALDAAPTIAGANRVIREGGGVEVRPVHSGVVVNRTTA